jgi:hypothetical protein
MVAATTTARQLLENSRAAASRRVDRHPLIRIRHQKYQRHGPEGAFSISGDEM